MTRLRSFLSRHGFSLLVAGCALLIFALAFFSPVTYAGSDGLFNLVTSQAILEHGTIRLDAYTSRIIPHMDRFPYDIVEHNGHKYSLYPLGTPLFSLPFVWVFNLMGRDLADIGYNYRLQNDISALLSALIFLLLYATGRCYVSRKASLVIALISVLGSALVSTVGTALWSVDFAVLFLALSLWILARYDVGRTRWWDPYLLGFALFSAFFSRPTAVTFILIVLLYLFVTHRREAFKVAVTASAFLLPFMAFNGLELGQPLPDYYMPLRWLRGSQMVQAFFDAFATALLFLLILLWLTRRKQRAKIAAAALGLLLLFLAFNWIQSGHPLPSLQSALERITGPPVQPAGSSRSGEGEPIQPAESQPSDGRYPIGLGAALYTSLLTPSRGLFIFSPFFAVVLLGLFLFWKKHGNPHLIVALLAYSCFHLLVLAATRTWHSGHSFGPRLLTDILPALVMLTFITWRAVAKHASPRWRRAGAASYVALGMLAILVNSYQGLFNVNTLHWNGSTILSLGGHPQYLYSWKYSQVLASNESLCARDLDHILTNFERDDVDLSTYLLGYPIHHTAGKGGRDMAGTELDPNALFVGWSRAQETYRSSECATSRIFFRLGEVDTAGREYVLEIQSGSHGAQQVAVYMNGAHIGHLEFPGPEEPPVERTLTLDGALLRSGEVNEIRFDMPGASAPSLADPRKLGLAFTSLTLSPD
jgi:hypothetical protein